MTGFFRAILGGFSLQPVQSGNARLLRRASAIALIFGAAVCAQTTKVALITPQRVDYEPIVSISALKIVEAATDERFSAEGNDPWILLGDARGTYLPSYGALFTFELNLVNVSPPTPFHMTITAQEVKSIHERKIKKLVVLKSTIRDLMINAATSLTTLPSAEQVTFEAYLIHFSFEDRTGLPRRLTMTANRQKLLDAASRHATPAEFAALIEEREE